MEEISKALETYVRLETFPVGIKMIKAQDKLESKFKRPLKDLKITVAICQSISIARRYGWSLWLTGEDVSCPLAKIAFGLEKSIPFYSDGQCCCGMYTETIEAGKLTESKVPKFKYKEYEGLAIAPLSRITYQPDVIVIYGNSAQVMRMVAGALYKTGGYIHSGFSSRLDCADTIIETIARNDYQVILPCYGDRVFGLTQDHEMAFAVPAGKIQALIVGLEATDKNGIRYPIPSYLRFTAEYPEKYEKLKELFKQGEK